MKARMKARMEACMKARMRMKARMKGSNESAFLLCGFCFVSSEIERFCLPSGVNI